MARMDTRIALGVQQPDFVNTLARSTAAAGQANAVRDQNALRQLFNTQGPQIMQGDQNALNALSQIDPNAALGIQGARQGMQAQSQLMEQRRVAAKRQAEEYARTADAREAAQAAAEIEQGLKRGIAAYQAGDLNGVNQILTQAGEQPISDLNQFPAVAAIYGDVFDTLKGVTEFNAGPKPADEYQRYVQEETAAGRQPLDRIAYAQAKKGKGFNVTLADGTVISQGGPQVPGGQNAATTNTPRDPEKLAKELSSSDAATLEEVSSSARGAAQLESLGGQLGVIAPNVGYSGPAGGLVGGVLDAAEAVGIDAPGTPGARGAMRSLGMEAQLAFTEKTKGAITDREMGMFREAVPGMSQRPEANAIIAEVMQAGAKRLQTRDAFYQDWARKYGSLEGANAVWSDYMRDNPIIEPRGQDQVGVRPEGDYRSYLNRRPANAYTPQAIMQMGREELMSAPISSMTEAQLDAYEARLEQVGGY